MSRTISTILFAIYTVLTSAYTTIHTFPPRQPSPLPQHSRRRNDFNRVTIPRQPPWLLSHRHRKTSNLTVRKMVPSIPCDGGTLSSSIAPLLFPVALGGGVIRPIPDGADGDKTHGYTVVNVGNDGNESVPPTDKEEEARSDLRCKVGDISSLVPGAFTISNILSESTCSELVDLTNRLLDRTISGEQNPSGDGGDSSSACTQTLVVPQQTADSLWEVMEGHLFDMLRRSEGVEHNEWTAVGLSRRWRFYRYNNKSNDDKNNNNDNDDVDLSKSVSDLRNDDGSGNNNVENTTIPTSAETVSRYTVLFYLTQDFTGGHTRFYASIEDEPDDPNVVVASVRPKTGSVLLFPQTTTTITTTAEEGTKQNRPTYDEIAVTSGGNKVVIKTDILFKKKPAPPIENDDDDKNDDPMYRYESAVRNVFLPTSPTLHPTFLSALSTLYDPHMGVENVGPVLYSFLRFVKARRVVEIGAGYTTPWILRALADNDEEMERIGRLVGEGRCRLLDYPWCVERKVEGYNESELPSSLLCVDNCLHQKEMASGAVGVARDLGIDQYLEFVQGDAFDMNFEPESNDVIWCDFGVGSRMADFVRGGAWSSLRLGGYLVCHSTLTNLRTREWLEALRSREPASEHLTGIPDGEEYAEVSLLEPHKHYQNSISVIQKRGLKAGIDDGGQEGRYVEPLYSEYA